MRVHFSAAPKRSVSERSWTQKHANVHKKAQMSAKERKCKRAQKSARGRKRAQKSAQERLRAKIANNQV